MHLPSYCVTPPLENLSHLLIISSTRKKPRRPQCRLALLHFAVKDASERERFDPCATDICLGRRQQFLFFFDDSVSRLHPPSAR